MSVGRDAAMRIATRLKGSGELWAWFAVALFGPVLDEACGGAAPNPRAAVHYPCSIGCVTRARSRILC
jgi:hypothetical protein